MRTAITLHLIAGQWEVGAGPDQPGVKNGVPVDIQRAAFFNPVGWPKQVTEAIFVTNDGQYHHTERKLAETLMAQTAAAEKRSAAKLDLSQKRVADQVLQREQQAEQERKEIAARHAVEVSAKEARKKGNATAVLPKK